MRMRPRRLDFEGAGFVTAASALRCAAHFTRGCGAGGVWVVNHGQRMGRVEGWGLPLCGVSCV